MRRLRVTERMITRAVADGLLCRVAPGVYRVRGAPETERMAIAAASLASDGRVARGTAASLLRLDAPLPATPIRIRVDAATGRQPRLQRIAVETAERRFHPVTVHRRGPVDEHAVVVDGIACTDATQTLIDLAGDLGVDQLEDAFERARRLGLTSASALAQRFEAIGGRGRKGAAKVREVLAHTRPCPLDSKLEGKTWRMIRSSSLPEPVRQLRIDLPRGRWYRIDFAWPELLVAVEAEGFEWHGTRAQWKADRIRVATLERLGWRVLVVTWDDVTQRRAETLDRIAMALAERARLGRSA
jgi:very-short-patch-repair endonuclease